MKHHLARRIASQPAWILEAFTTVMDAYLLGLLVAARFGGGSSDERARGPLPSLVVLVPAHDEEPVIADTIASLVAQDYPPGLSEIVVVADNCTDATATRARSAGATVWERLAPQAHGKGRALAWALDHLRALEVPPAGVVIVDADCIASPNLLTAIGERIAAGDLAVQATYVVSNADDSPAAALRFAAFSLVHDVRMAGKAALGLSVGLMGTGMGFAWELVERVPWDAFSITEDAEYHLRLVTAGGTVCFAPEASVESPMPTSLANSIDQQTRWEAGKSQIAARQLPRMIRQGVATGDAVMIHAAIEVLLPPQSAILAANFAGSALAVAAAQRSPLRRLAAVNLLAQATFVFGGLAFVRAPASAYRSLLLAPLLVARKGTIFVRLARGQRPDAFVRTTREAPDAPSR